MDFEDLGCHIILTADSKGTKKMKKRYSRRYICEAIAYWKKQLRQLNESTTFLYESEYKEQDLIDMCNKCAAASAAAHAAHAAHCALAAKEPSGVERDPNEVEEEKKLRQTMNALDAALAAARGALAAYRAGPATTLAY